ncbi:hypothetical protein LCGC14_0634590 [marine sediment metagenome]|uniref:Uncharacterized protein n=1 Tax=marine sediment metagenome TaxID=412755 RepID=A0A0F9RKE9_9ZZZZ
MIFELTMGQMIFLNHLMMYLSTIGFGIALANAFIGISYIRDLNELTLLEIKAHKRFGWTAATIFYLLSVLCIYFAVIPRLNLSKFDEFFIDTILWHTFLGGIIAFILFTFKFFIARYKKDFIYKYGKIIGPLGFSGWALAYFTSNIDFYFFVNPSMDIPVPYLMPNYLISLIISIFIGFCLFSSVKAFKFRAYGSTEKRHQLHGVSMILHGITFGYEGSARELVGTPVLYKYVFPKTYEFLKRYAKYIGLDLEDLKKHNLNEALDIAIKAFEKIGMAEKINLEWISEKELIVESINCSTAVVRSYMEPEELTNSICPWSILVATIVNALTGKDIELSPSEFNKIGAKSKLTIVEKTI